MLQFQHSIAVAIGATLFVSCGSTHNHRNLYLKEAEGEKRHVTAYVPGEDVYDSATRERLRPCVCAEPSPDVAFTTKTGIGGSFANTLQMGGGAELAANVSVARDVVDLARRSQTLQLVREIGYRICESRCNGQRDDALLIALMDNMKELLVIEQKRYGLDSIRAASEEAQYRYKSKLDSLIKKLDSRE